MATKTKNPYGTTKRFIVKRSRWLRNIQDDDPQSALMVGNKMCCLGFYCRAAGKTPKEIRGIGLPHSIEVDVGTGNKDDECSIAVTNDNDEITDRERESILRKKFKAIGVTVKFVD